MGQPVIVVSATKSSVNQRPWWARGGFRTGRGEPGTFDARAFAREGCRRERLSGPERRTVERSSTLVLVLGAAGVALSAGAAADLLPRAPQSVATAGAAVGQRQDPMVSMGEVQVANQRQDTIAQLIKKAEDQGHVRVIVGLRLPDGFTPEGGLPDRDAVMRQRGNIATARKALTDSLRGSDATSYASWDSLPSVGLRVSASALRRLAASPYVTTLQEDRADPPSAAQ